jgi:hypothetical protein
MEFPMKNASAVHTSPFHLLNTGHFALEDRFDTMVPLIRDFLDRSRGRA